MSLLIELLVVAGAIAVVGFAYELALEGVAFALRRRQQRRAWEATLRPPPPVPSLAEQSRDAMPAECRGRTPPASCILSGGPAHGLEIDNAAGGLCNLQLWVVIRGSPSDPRPAPSPLLPGYAFPYRLRLPIALRDGRAVLDYAGAADWPVGTLSIAQRTLLAATHLMQEQREGASP